MNILSGCSSVPGLACGFVAALLLSLPALATPSTFYTVEIMAPLKVSSGHAQRTEASAINDNGTIAGIANTDDTMTAVVFSNHACAPLKIKTGNEVALYSSATGINAAETIVGQAKLLSGTYGFVVINNQISALMPLANETGSEALGINESGVIVGSSSKDDRTTAVWTNEEHRHQLVALSSPRGVKTCRATAATEVETFFGTCNDGTTDFAVTWKSDGSELELELPPGTKASQVSAANRFGCAVGTTLHGSQNVATAWNPQGAPVLLGMLKGDLTSAALAVNKFGLVVGSSGEKAKKHAVIFQNGEVIDLNTRIVADSPFSNLQAATGVNSSGQIVGYGVISSGEVRGFVLTPIAGVMLN